jgi:hypothetical protein
MRHARRGVRALAVLALVWVAGCSDILAAAGLTRLNGYWIGSYDDDFEFYMDLDDDLLGLYGRAGLVLGGSETRIYVDGERNGSSIRIYSNDIEYGDDTLIFEGEVTGRDRITGIAYLEIIPHFVTLHRQ